MRFLRLSSHVVPSASRRDWLNEFQGEFWQLQHRGSPSTRTEMLFLMGALMHAAFERLQQWSLRELRDDAPSLRSLLRYRFSSVVSVLSLALGIAAATTVFAVVYTLIFRPLPYPDPENLWVGLEVRVQTTPGRQWIDSIPQEISHFDFNQWREHSRSFAELAGFGRRRIEKTLVGAGGPHRVLTRAVTPGFFPILRVEPALGHGFEEEGPGSEFRAVLSHRLWTSEFGRDPEIVGKSIRLDDQLHTIVGVLPADFHFLHDETEIWLPLVIRASEQTAHVLRVVGRLKAGVTASQAKADLDAIFEGAGGVHFQRSPLLKGVGIATRANLTTLQEHYRELNLGPFSDRKPRLTLLVAVIGCVLLIACLNVATLRLGRGFGRRRELAVRTVLGAGRARLVRLLVAESLILGGLGGTLGIVLSNLALRVLAAQPILDLRRFTIGLEPPVVFGALLLTLLTAVLVGLIPAFVSTGSRLDEALRSGLAFPAKSGHYLMRGLVVVEIGLGLTLVIGVTFLVSSLIRLHRVDPGFERENLAVMEANLPQKKYLDPVDPNRLGSSLTYLQTELLSRVRALPGIVSAALTNSVTSDPGVIMYRVEGIMDPPDRPPHALTFRPVTEGYFETMRIPLRRGRVFEPQDIGTERALAVISERAGPRIWPEGESARTFSFQDMLTKPRIPLGMVTDVRLDSIDKEPRSTVYFPYSELPMTLPGGRLRLSFSLVFRTHARPQDSFPGIRGILSELDPEQPADFRTMNDVLAEQLAERSLYTSILLVSAVGALALAAIGIFGITSLLVITRIREIGIRMTLGANRARVGGMVLRQVSQLAVFGLIIGAVGGHQLMGLLQGLLFGVQAGDPAIWMVSSGVILATCLAACVGPLRRATGVNPADSLRAD